MRSFKCHTLFPSLPRSACSTRASTCRIVVLRFTAANRESYARAFRPWLQSYLDAVGWFCPWRCAAGRQMTDRRRSSCGLRQKITSRYGCLSLSAFLSLSTYQHPLHHSFHFITHHRIFQPLSHNAALVDIVLNPQLRNEATGPSDVFSITSLKVSAPKALPDLSRTVVPPNRLTPASAEQQNFRTGQSSTVATIHEDQVANDGWSAFGGAFDSNAEFNTAASANAVIAAAPSAASAPSTGTLTRKPNDSSSKEQTAAVSGDDWGSSSTDPWNTTGNSFSNYK